jgi:hypothetical protein
MARRKKYRQASERKIRTAGWAKPMTFGEVLAQFKAGHELGRNDAIERWTDGCIAYHGFQRRNQNGRRDDERADSRYRSRKVAGKNILRQLVSSTASHVLSQNPTMEVRPRTADRRDVAAARVANSYLRFLEDDQNLDRKNWLWALETLLGGTGVCVVRWDPSAGQVMMVPRVDEQLGVLLVDKSGEPLMDNEGPEGAVSVDIAKIDECRWDTEDWQKATMFHLARWIDLASAEEIAVAEGCPPNKIKSHNGAVEIEELWVKPSPRYPAGGYALFLGGECVAHRDFPYKHNMLPFAVWELDRIPGEAYCTGAVSDAIPTQRWVDELEQIKKDFTRNAGRLRLLANNQVVEALEGDDTVIPWTTGADINQAARYLEPPLPSPLVFAQQQEQIASITAVYGGNEVLTGRATPTSNTPAKQIAFLVELETRRLGGMIKNFEVALERVFQLALATAQQYIKNERAIRLVDGTETDWVSFTGSDLRGSVVLESASRKYLTRGARADAAGQGAAAAAQAGQPNPDLQEMAETGLSDTMSNGEAKKKIDAQIRMVIQGQQVEPDPTIPPAIAVEQLMTAMVAYPDNQAEIGELRQAYEQMQAQQQQSVGGGMMQ